MSTILQCSRINDKNENSKNSNWVNTFASPVEIEDGDVVQMKLAFIDSLNSPSDIHIPENVTASMEFCYYVHNWNIGDPTENNDMYYNPYNIHQDKDGAGNVLYHTTNLGTYGDYICWVWNKADGKAFEYSNSNECYPLITSVDVNIPAGQYQGNELAKVITDQLSELELKDYGYERLFLDKNGFLKASKVEDGEDRNYPYHFWRVNGENDSVPNHQTDYGFVYSDYALDITTDPFTSNENLLDNDSTGGWFFGASQVSLVFSDNNKYNFEYLHTPIFNSTPNTAPVMSNVLTNLPNSSNFLYLDAKVDSHTQATTTTKPTPGEMQLYKNGGNVLFIFHGGGEVTVSLNADITADGVMTFPIVNDPDWGLDGDPCTTRVDEPTADPVDHWRTSTRQGGIYLSSLTSVIKGTTTDAKFWELLGFNPSNITVPYNKDKMPKQSELHRSSTGGFLGLSALISKSGKMKINPNRNENAPTYLSADEDVTRGILAGDYDSNDILNKPFYTIECISNFKTMYQDDTDIKRNVSAIVSKQWSNNKFITGYGGESSIVYEHRGEPMLLSSVNVRVLEGTIEPDNLGNENTIIIEVIKASTSS